MVRRPETIAFPPPLTLNPVVMKKATFAVHAWATLSTLPSARKVLLSAGFNSVLVSGFRLLVIHPAHLLQALLSLRPAILGLLFKFLRRNDGLLTNIGTIMSLEVDPLKSHQVTNRHFNL